MLTAVVLVVMCVQALLVAFNLWCIMAVHRRTGRHPSPVYGVGTLMAVCVLSVATRSDIPVAAVLVAGALAELSAVAADVFRRRA